MKSLAPIVTSCILLLISSGCVGPKAFGGDVWADSAAKPTDVQLAIAAKDISAEPTADMAPDEWAPVVDVVSTPPDTGPPLIADIAALTDVENEVPIEVADVTLPSGYTDANPPDLKDIAWPTITTDVGSPLTKDTTAPSGKKDATTKPDVGSPAADSVATGVVDTGPPVIPDAVAVVDVAPPVDTVSVVAADTVQPVDATTQPQPAGLVYGMTLDAVDNLAAIVDALKSLPVKPWVRIVFDYPLQPSDYTAAVAAIAPYAVIVGQPSDSTYNAKMTVAEYRARFQAYVDQLPQINIWETCNECNGDWLGPNASAQADAATDVVKSAGKKALFTPYWNTNTCADKNGPYVAWIAKNISAAVKTESDYVTPSIYGFDCDGPEPAYAELDAMVQTFAAMFPNAQVGIGEYGKQGDATILKYYLGYPNPNPRYVFAGLYWYGKQDFVPKTQPLWGIFAAGMK